MPGLMLGFCLGVLVFWLGSELLNAIGYSDLSYGLCIALGIAVVLASVAGLWFLMLQHFERLYSLRYRAAIEALDDSELPVLIVDESFMRGLLQSQNDEFQLLWTGSPTVASLEEQLNSAAAYFRALKRFNLTSAESKSPLLRLGNESWWANTPVARNLSCAASAAACFPYTTCIIVLLAWPLLRGCAMRVEQQATLAAICDWFGGCPGRSDIPSSVPIEGAERTNALRE